MNNAKIALDNVAVLQENTTDPSPWLRSREAEVVKIIEVLKAIQDTREWSSLKELVLDGILQRLEKALVDEAKKDDPDKSTLARINGQLLWAKRYSDLGTWCDSLRLELSNIRKNLHGKEEEWRGGRYR